jgi:peroxiredoxin
MSTPQQTTQIPDFRLPASTGHTLSLDSFRGKVPLVLVFLPDPHSSDGVSILEELDRRLKDFGAERAQVLAIAQETARRVRELADERGISLPILADASGAMARDFSADDTDRPVAVVGDREGHIKRRFDPFFEGADPKPAVDSLLYTVRATGSGALEELRHEGGAR